MIRDHIRPHIRPHIRGFTEGLAGLSPPAGVTATVSGSDIDITWTAASSVDGYNIYQSIDDGAWTKLNATTETGTSYTLTPIDPGEYNFRVTSVRGDKESTPSAETTTTESMMTQVYTDTISGLRISAVDGTAFVDLDDTTILESGSATQDEVRISAVDGTAFVDSVSSTFSTDLVANVGKKLVLKDSAGKELVGWIKTQGSGETLGSELVTNGTFDTDTTGWTPGSGATLSVVTGQLNITNSPGDNFSVAHQEQTLAALGLFIFDRDNVSFTSGGASRIDKTSGSFDPISSNNSAVSQKSEYFTYSAASAYVQLSSAGDGATAIFDDVSLKQVTAPSTSGATIVSSFNGTTYNWESQDVDFDYNDASGYTYEILSEGVHGYADGNHLLEVQDSLGNVASGVLKVQGSGETLGADVMLRDDIIVPALWTDNGDGSFTKASGDTDAIKWNGNIISDNILYYSSVTTSGVTAGTITLRLGWLGFVSANYNASFFTYGTVNPTTRVNNAVYIRPEATNFVGTVTLDFVKQVTAPSTSGCTLVDEISGTDQNFFDVPAGFVFNEASYTVTVKKILPTA